MPNSYTNLLFHLVCGTKDRRPFIGDGWRGELDRYIGGLVQEKGGELLEIGGMPDHIHLSIRSRPDISVSDLMCFIKANSSGWIHKQGFCPEFGWQDGYGAFTVSKSQAPAVSHYIRTQPAHHRRKTFDEEFAELLERHGIKFNPRYLWK
jgi:REP element-mobilizing transposase RayT